MIPVVQLVVGDGKDGRPSGDCFRACLASIRAYLTTARKYRTLPGMNPMIIRGGNLLDLDNIDPAVFTTDMVCHSLAGTERYNSQAGAWTVAEHALCVAALICWDLESWMPRSDVLDATHAGLCHDNGEAIYGDVIRPLACYMGPEFKAFVRRVDDAMDKAFDVKPFNWHPYDLALLEAERLHFFPRSKPWATSAAFPARLLERASYLVWSTEGLDRHDRENLLRRGHEMLKEARKDDAPLHGMSQMLVTQ